MSPRAPQDQSAAVMDADQIGEAVARVRALQTEHAIQARTIVELQRRLDQSNDRVAMLQEEMRNSKRDAKIYHKHLIALASSMSNIGLLTAKAQELMLTVQEALDAETPEEAEEERASAADIISRLPQNQI